MWPRPTSECRNGPLCGSREERARPPWLRLVWFRSRRALLLLSCRLKTMMSFEAENAMDLISLRSLELYAVPKAKFAVGCAATARAGVRAVHAPTTHSKEASPLSPSHSG